MATELNTERLQATGDYVSIENSQCGFWHICIHLV